MQDFHTFSPPLAAILHTEGQEKQKPSAASQSIQQPAVAHIHHCIIYFFVVFKTLLPYTYTHFVII